MMSGPSVSVQQANTASDHLKADPASPTPCRMGHHRLPIGFDNRRPTSTDPSGRRLCSRVAARQPNPDIQSVGPFQKCRTTGMGCSPVKDRPCNHQGALSCQEPGTLSCQECELIPRTCQSVDDMITPDDLTTLQLSTSPTAGPYHLLL